MFNQHPSSKGTRGIVVEHIFIEFVAVAVGDVVDNKRIVVYMLLLVGNDTAAQPALCTLAAEVQVESVTSGAIVQGDDIVGDMAVGLLLHIDIANAGVLHMSLFQAIEVNGRARHGKHLGDLRGEKMQVVGRMVTEQQRHRATFFCHDEHTPVHHERGPCPLPFPRRKIGKRSLQDVDDLDSPVDNHTSGHIDEQTVLSKHGVQTAYSIIVGSQTVVIITDEMGIF